MDSKRTVISTQPVRPKNILFSCFVYVDGLGDLGHLVSVVKPEVLKSMPVKIGTETADAINPLYMIVCKYEQIEFVIETLISANIIKKEESSFLQKKKEFGEDADTDDFVEAYVNELSEKYPNVFVHLYSESCDIPSTVLAENDDDYAELEERIMNRLEGTSFYEQMKDTILQVNISMPFAINIFKDLERTPLKINIAEHGSGFFSRNSIDECIMGFGENHQGIFLQDIKPVPLEQKIVRVSQIQNKEYLLNLLSLQQLKQQDAKVVDKENFGLSSVDLCKYIKQFLETTLFIPGYIQDKIAMATFISSLSFSYVAKRSEEVVFHINKSSFEPSMLAEDLLRANGITAIEINNAGQITTNVLIENAVKPKKIRILTGFYLSNEDYEFLFGIAQYFAGCSGDKSLEQTLSAGLIPFYAARPWKEKLVDDLVVAGEKYSEDKAVTAYNKFFNQVETPYVRKVERFPAPNKINANIFYLVKEKKNYADKGKYAPGTWKLYEPIGDILTEGMELRECKDISLKEYDGHSDIHLTAGMNVVRKQVRAYIAKKKVQKDAAYIASQCNTPQFYSEYKKIINGFKEDYNFGDILPTVILQGIAFYQLQRAIGDDKLDRFNLYHSFKTLDVIKNPYGLNDFFRIALMINDEKLAIFLLKLFISNMNDSGKFKIVTHAQSFTLDLGDKDEFFDEFFAVINKYKDTIMANESLLAIMKAFTVDSYHVDNSVSMQMNMIIEQFLPSPVKAKKEESEEMEHKQDYSENSQYIVILSSSSSTTSSASDTGMFAESAANNKKRKAEIDHSETEHHKIPYNNLARIKPNGK